MAEFDTIFVCNPTDEDFTVRFNGEPYTITGGDQKQYVVPVALHFAKHFSDKILTEQFSKKRTAKVYKDNPKLRENDPEKTQYTMLDNPHRRIELYKILRSKEMVEEVIKRYSQFKFRDRHDNKSGEENFSFIGEMSVYDDFVTNFEKPETPKKQAPEKVDLPKGT